MTALRYPQQWSCFAVEAGNFASTEGHHHLGYMHPAWQEGGITRGYDITDVYYQSRLKGQSGDGESSPTANFDSGTGSRALTCEGSAVSREASLKLENSFGTPFAGMVAPTESGFPLPIGSGLGAGAPLGGNYSQYLHTTKHAVGDWPHLSGANVPLSTGEAPEGCFRPQSMLTSDYPPSWPGNIAEGYSYTPPYSQEPATSYPMLGILNTVCGIQSEILRLLEYLSHREGSGYFSGLECRRSTTHYKNDVTQARRTRQEPRHRDGSRRKRAPRREPTIHRPTTPSGLRKRPS
ncbi:hypothetical protein TWF281_004844 [Arthrobotrys megalospora]